MNNSVVVNGAFLFCTWEFLTLYLSGFIALNTLFTSPVFMASSAKEFSLRNSRLGILEFLKRHPLTPRKSRIPREFNMGILVWEF